MSVTQTGVPDYLPYKQRKLATARILDPGGLHHERNGVDGYLILVLFAAG